MSTACPVHGQSSGGGNGKPRDSWEPPNLVPHLVLFIVVAVFLAYLCNALESPAYDDDHFNKKFSSKNSPHGGGATEQEKSAEKMEKVIEVIRTLENEKGNETLNKILAAAAFVVPASGQEDFTRFLSLIRTLTKPSLTEWLREHPDLKNKVWQASRRWCPAALRW